ncbi:imidazoleglycerol-phosphate dehydratase [Acetomicrobium hydrogeniformans]|uniref:Imidazoleglycerol-phosphate dehydratase n=1 Tax=Acetomicrobium hydrogeniformans TaxID=649746 RepID=A0A7V6ZFW8_9BACT|nr:imidazoleglycerol-phosphate dehydratase [Acetomicrobium hydrogeniformans]HHZ05088.1 imidazoleglycerol-phosphate dehydratase [Acetomicrobium hydrogeniformans]
MYEAFRRTEETMVKVSLALDGEGIEIDVPVGFLGHMLELLLFNAGICGRIEARGDTHVDDHHTVEDVAITLGRALKELWTSRQIERYGWAAIPMDETLVLAALDASGRGSFSWKGSFPSPKCGNFDTELIPEFWRAFSREAALTLHLQALSVDNSHHLAEATFKAVGRALKQALKPSERPSSTKGAII